MKLIVLLWLATALILSAAPTDLASAANSGETHITSESVNFDLKSRQAIYRGNVHVNDPRISLKCEWLAATISSSGGRVDNLVAETNVVALIATNETVFTVKAAKATYTYQVQPTVTNQTLELTGTPEPTITWPQPESDPVRTNEFAARRILWDIGTGNISAEGHRGVFPSVETFNNPLKELEQAASTNSASASKNP